MSVDFLHQLVQVEVRVGELHRPGFYLGEVEDVVHQLQQQVAVVLDDVDILRALVLGLGIDQQFAEAYNGTERRAYLVAHVGEEGRFQTVGLFGLLLGGPQLFLHYLAGRDHLPGTHQHQRFSVLVAGADGGTHFDPFQVRFAVLFVFQSAFFFHLCLLSFYQFVHGLAYVLAVVWMDVGIDFPHLLRLVLMNRRARLIADVLLVIEQPVLHFVAPGRDVRGLQGNLHLLVQLAQLLFSMKRPPSTGCTMMSKKRLLSG